MDQFDFQKSVQEDQQIRNRKITQTEFNEKIQYFNNMKMEDVNSEIEILNKDQRMELRKTILRKFTTQYSTLDDNDHSLVTSFLKKSFFLTFGATGVYKICSQKNIMGFNPQKYMFSRVLGMKYGIGVYAPLMLVCFKDFIFVTFKVGLKHRYIYEHISQLE